MPLRFPTLALPATEFPLAGGFVFPPGLTVPHSPGAGALTMRERGEGGAPSDRMWCPACWGNAYGVQETCPPLPSPDVSAQTPKRVRQAVRRPLGNSFARVRAHGEA